MTSERSFPCGARDGATDASSRTKTEPALIASRGKTGAAPRQASVPGTRNTRTREYTNPGIHGLENSRTRVMRTIGAAGKGTAAAEETAACRWAGGDIIIPSKDHAGAGDWRTLRSCPGRSYRVCACGTRASGTRARRTRACSERWRRGEEMGKDVRSRTPSPAFCERKGRRAAPTTLHILRPGFI